MSTTTPTGPCLIAPVAGGRADWDHATNVDMRPVPRSRWNAGGTGKGGRRQQRILDYLRRFIGEHGYAPTLREIADACGLRAISAVTYHLEILQDRGHLALGDVHKARAITLLDREAP